MMKVLQINATHSIGSTGTIVCDIKDCCEKEGIECHIAYSLALEQNPSHSYQIGNVLDHKIHALLCRINGNQGYFSHISTKALLNYIEKLNPDIVHLHNLHSNYLHLNMLLNYLAKHDIKTVVTLHDCWFYTGGCFHYTVDKCYKWVENCGNCPKKKTDTPAFFLDKSSAILFDRIKYFGSISRLFVTGVSSWILSEGEKKVFKSRPSEVVYNGVDMDVFKPTVSNLRDKLGLKDKKVILGLANKWLDSINKDTFYYFVNNMPADQVLILFGTINNQVSVPNNVMLYGYTQNRKELAQLYSIADVFVNCTREESMSLINAESQACGTPVVTYDSTGVQETVDNKCGFAIESGNYKMLFDKTQDILFHPIEASACIKWADEKFEKYKNYKKYINIYRGL